MATKCRSVSATSSRQIMSIASKIATNQVVVGWFKPTPWELPNSLLFLVDSTNSSPKPRKLFFWVQGWSCFGILAKSNFHTWFKFLRVVKVFLYLPHPVPYVGLAGIDMYLIGQWINQQMARKVSSCIICRLGGLPCAWNINPDVPWFRTENRGSPYEHEPCSVFESSIHLET